MKYIDTPFTLTKSRTQMFRISCDLDLPNSFPIYIKHGPCTNQVRYMFDIGTGQILRSTNMGCRVHIGHVFGADTLHMAKAVGHAMGQCPIKK